MALGSAKLNRSDTREPLDDCNTARVQEITINNKKDLEFYRFKYYKGTNNKFDKFIDHDSYDLIGKTLKIRSITTCDGDNIICKKCYGANSRFAVDTSIYKVNINDYTLVLVAMICQGVISIKHFLGGILMKMIVNYNDKTYELKDFMEEYDIITSLEYNVVTFRSDCICHLFKEDPSDEYESLFVDGVKLGYDREIIKVSGHNKYKFKIPNDSVMRRAQNLLTALNGHRNKDYFTKKKDFDIEDFIDLDIESQLMSILDYLRDRIKLNHFIHYELMVYGLTRDADNKSQRVTKDTEKILFMHSNDILCFPDRNHSLASTIPYGYISRAFSCLYKDTRPDEYDLLMANLVNKEPNADTAYREMNRELSNAIEVNDEYFGSKEGLLED